MWAKPHSQWKMKHEIKWTQCFSQIQMYLWKDRWIKRPFWRGVMFRKKTPCCLFTAWHKNTLVNIHLCQYILIIREPLEKRIQCEVSIFFDKMWILSFERTCFFMCVTSTDGSSHSSSGIPRSTFTPFWTRFFRVDMVWLVPCNPMAQGGKTF